MNVPFSEFFISREREEEEKSNQNILNRIVEYV